MTLTPKQQRFVEEYIVDSNATQAAIRAGYSKRSANQQGPRLLVNVGIAAAIEERQAEGRKRNEVTVDGITAEYDEARAMARDQKNPAVMGSMSEKKAKLHGLVTDKVNVGADESLAAVLREINGRTRGLPRPGRKGGSC